MRKKFIISRTLERGVGSFYKINNKDVRAKDVSIFFMILEVVQDQALLLVKEILIKL